MPRLVWWAALLCAVLITGPPVRAAETVEVANDPGGIIGTFIDKYTHIRVAGQRVVVRGYCNSACTLITGLVPADRVCVAPGAVFGFHSAFDRDPGRFAPDGTALLWSIYPAKVRAMLRRRGWDGRTAHPNLITIDGTALYRRCQES